MEIGYAVNNGVIHIGKDNKNNYYYRVHSDTRYDIDFDCICEKMESFGIANRTVPEIYKSEYHGTHLLMNASMTYSSNKKFFKELEENIFQLFANRNHMTALLKILNGQSLISLRLIDWFVNVHAEKCNTKISNNGHIIYVHDEYEKQCAKYFRKYFDAFARKKKYRFVYDGKNFCSSLGQLNFMYWAFENGIIDYISDNLEEIEEDMIGATRKRSYINEIDCTMTKKQKTNEKCSGVIFFN